MWWHKHSESINVKHITLFVFLPLLYVCTCIPYYSLQLAPPPTTPLVTLGEVTSTSVVVSWSSQTVVCSYEISFQRATGNEQLGDCTSFDHSGNVSVGGNITMYNLTGLQEFSTYFITVMAINAAGRNESGPVPVTTTMAGTYVVANHVQR